MKVYHKTKTKSKAKIKLTLENFISVIFTKVILYISNISNILYGHTLNIIIHHHYLIPIDAEFATVIVSLNFDLIFPRLLFIRW